MSESLSFKSLGRCEYGETLHMMKTHISNEDFKNEKGNFMTKRELDIRVIDPYGRNALFYTNEEVTRYLVNKGLDVRTETDAAISDLKQTPIFTNPYPNAVKFLLDSGANVNKKDKYGMTAIMVNSNPDVVRVLLEGRANPNIYSNDG